MTNAKTFTVQIIRYDGLGKRDVLETLEVYKIAIDRQQFMHFYCHNGACASYKLSHHLFYRILPN